ncbi:hypothetical protein DPEC_G00079430 [Dallia pectoralis]|uniref:Uncharacterized protein n=1 Tax=Dallia pectoralis TaxID=75939 RepID=A0ACC2H4S4_DALPE|nr:hypothetical protein DPEC_G00079430 [Dallia pectoralis]
MPIAGGWSEIMPATEEVQKICDQVCADGGDLYLTVFQPLEGKPALLDVIRIYEDKMPTLGGWSDIMPATEEVQKICNQMKKDVEIKLKQKFPMLKALTYQHQVVKGYNYFIKTDTGADCQSSIYLSVYRDLSGKLELKDAVKIELSPLNEALPFSLDQLKHVVEKKTGKTYSKFKGINYKILLTQLMGYQDFFIKVKAGEGIKDFLILHVGCAVYPGAEPEFKGLLVNKTLNDPIEYFK